MQEDAVEEKNRQAVKKKRYSEEQRDAEQRDPD